MFNFFTTESALAVGSSANDQASNLYWAHMAVLIFGLIFCGVLAARAFGRSIPLADMPTFPRYMIGRRQYQLGCGCFVALSMLIFFLLVYLNKELMPVLDVFDHDLYTKIEPYVKGESTPYFFIIVLVASIFLTLLHREGEWNLVLMLRDLIQSCIRIPNLVRKIVNSTKYELNVPIELRHSIVSDSMTPHVHLEDFTKDRRTIDRQWAELSYIRWWLEQRRLEGSEATFFDETSFNWKELVKEYDACSYKFGIGRSEEVPPGYFNIVAQDIDNLRTKFARLAACYLVFNNGYESSLLNQARSFGIDIAPMTSENPLSYSIVYLATVFAAVYLGVYCSAIIFDLLQGQSLPVALQNQNPYLVERWVAYAAANYGGAIILVLSIRYFWWKPVAIYHQSYLISYCSTFFISLFVGPLVLTMAIELFGPASIKASDFFPLYFGRELLWGIGPGLISVYICYYLDRQTQSDLPDIDRQGGSMIPKIFYSLMFTCGVMLVLLPRLMAIVPLETIWSAGKVRFVATGATLLVTLSLALVAQFGLRKETFGLASFGGKPPVAQQS
jgi:hypothetical protein